MTHLNSAWQNFLLFKSHEKECLKKSEYESSVELFLTYLMFD